MPRLIDADALCESMRTWQAKLKPEYFIVDRVKSDVLNTAIVVIENLPTIDAEPVRHGRWEDGKCTECGEDAPYTEIEEAVYDYDWEENLRFSHTETHREYNETPYCPHCGAKMDGGAE